MRNLWHVGLSSVLLGGSLALAGCAGETFTSESTQGDAVTGGACTTDGAKTEASDGCNTCECVSGAWACTEEVCPSPACEEGDTSDDGCNTCECVSGAWACTDVACPTPACDEGDTSDDGCNSCMCSGGEWLCTNVECPSTCVEGETMPAGDGCNTCTCVDGSFLCTRSACPVPQCQDGEVLVDECSHCECSGGQWLCSGTQCPEPLCPPSQIPAGDVICAAVMVYARDPASGACCSYPTPCNAPLGWTQFSTIEECEGTTNVCVPGDTWSDGCNTCTCDASGLMMCTTMFCVCEAGATTRAADGCNVCTCDAQGGWACTEMACTDPVISCGGWSGDTCTDDEYCAYEPGAYCGGADASATCQPRPQGCDAIYEPVCGCDGVTYSSSCDAAMAGTGVMDLGVCPNITPLPF